MKGRCRVIAIKECIDLYPDADVVYGCDQAWWRHRKGLPEFPGLKISYDPPFPDIRRLSIEKHTDSLLFETGKTGSGGNSGFQALNLAVQWGAKPILLIGFDMTDANGVHWYGRNNWLAANNPDQANFKRWIAAFNSAASVLASMGVEVVNCSLNSALDCFPKISLEEAVDGRA